MSSNPNLPKLERLQTHQDLYPDLGEFVLETIADIRGASLEDFNKVVAISFTMAYFNIQTYEEVKTRSKELNFLLIFEEIKPLLGLYIYSICPKVTQKKFKQNTPFDELLELNCISRYIADKLRDTTTGVEFWNDMLASIQKYQELATKKHKEFLQGPRQLRKYKNRILDAISANTAKSFRDLFQSAPESEVQKKIPGFNDPHHEVVASSLSKGSKDSNPERILQSIRMLKVLKYIHPDLETFSGIYTRIQQDFAPSHLQEFQGEYHLKPFTPGSFLDTHDLDQVTQFILFTNPNPQLVSVDPFRLGTLELEPTTDIEGQVYLTESSLALQLRSFYQVLDMVQELSQTQKKPVLKNGDTRYADISLKVSHTISTEVLTETVGSSLDNFLDSFISQQLDTHGLNLHPVTEHYFRMYAKYQILNLTTNFDANSGQIGALFMFVPEQDSLSDAIDSEAFFQAKLAHMTTQDVENGLFDRESLSIFKERLKFEDKIVLISPATHEYVALAYDKNLEGIIDSFDSVLDAELSIKDSYISLSRKLESLFDISTILADILNSFNANQHLENILGAQLLLSNLSDEQLVELYNIDPQGILDTIEKVIKELESGSLEDVDDVSMILEMIKVAHTQKGITTRKKNQLIKNLQKVVDQNTLIERLDAEFEITPSNIFSLANKIKLHAYYYNLIKISKARTLTSDHVQAIAYMLSDLEQIKLTERLFEDLASSKTLSNFLHILSQNPQDEHCESLYEDFLDIIFQKIKTGNNLKEVMSLLDISSLKAIYGVENQLPERYSLCIQQQLQELQNDGSHHLSNLKMILPQLTSKVPHNSTNQAIKSLMS